MAKPKKRKANPRIRAKATPGPGKTVVRWDKAPRLTQAKLAKCRKHKWSANTPHQTCPICVATKNQNQAVQEREKLIDMLKVELAEARWQRQYAYSIRHSPVYLRGQLFDPGLKTGSEHDLRRAMCDMWVSCLHRLHRLILGLPPEPDATELEYPIKIATLPSRAHTLHT